MLGKKVLVTGGNGYIGARLSLHLAKQGYEVTPLCYPEIPKDKMWCEAMKDVVVGDIRDEGFLRELAVRNFDVIIHLVSLDHHQSNGNPSFVSSVNITPTWSLLDIFSRMGLKKFIYFSTMQVYGILPNDNITENHIPRTTNAYALTHLIGEQICDHYNRNSTTKCRVVRLSNSYGAPVFAENNCWWLVVNDLCKNAVQHNEIILQSDGSPTRDFIHGNDVAAAVEAIISTDAQYDTYNVSSGETLSIFELSQAVQKIFKNRYGKDIEIKKDKTKNSRIVERYRIDNSRLRSIGFKTLWDLEHGINDLFDYLEQR